MTTTRDITVRTTDPIDLAETCLQAAVIHGDRAADHRDAGQHSAAGIDREQQRYYLARACAHAEISQAQSLRSIADDLARLGLLR